MEANNEIIQFQIYDSNEGTFNKSKVYNQIYVPSNLKVKNVIVLDINKDGEIDLIVTSLNKNQNNSIVNDLYLGKSSGKDEDRIVNYEIGLTINEEIFVANLLGNNNESIVFYDRIKKERMFYHYVEEKLLL